MTRLVLQRELLLFLAGGGIAAALAVMAYRAFPLGSRPFFVALAIAVAAYAFALWLVATLPAVTPRVVIISLGIALAMRLPLAGAPVGAENDIFRYLWDARLQRAGLNPYEISPDDPAVAHLHTAQTRKMNNRDVTTPYPAAAQLLFRVATSAGESVQAVRAALLVCDVLIALLLWRWLVSQQRNALLVIVYAWNPLVAVEVAAGHFDVAGGLLVLAAAVAISRGHRMTATVAFATSVAMKFLPIVLAPLLWKRVRIRDAVVGVLVVCTLYAPYCSGSAVPLGSVPDVVDRFRFNAPIFEFFENHLGALAATGVPVAIGLLVATLLQRRLRIADPAAWAWPMAAALVCSPLVYPWYLLWLAPFLVTIETSPLLVWTVSVLPVYAVWELFRQGASWGVPSFVLALEYGLVAMAAVSLFWVRRVSLHATPAPAPSPPATGPLRISVVVPTHNECDAIGRVLRDIPSRLASEVIVVDSNSDDGTPEVAAALGARVVREPRRGYGRACLMGIETASTPDVLVFLDGDFSDRPAELPELLRPIQEGRADIVIGSRLAGRLQPGAMPIHARWGNHLAAWLIRRLYGAQITDLGPFRAARADTLRALQLRETTYGWAVELIVRGSSRGYRVVEVPVSYYPRLGRSKISGTWRGTMGAAWGILSGIVKYRVRPR